ncbi:hypothetical protein J6590_070281 [Homalodisca vitripennis]|nr:hypothetical protein J6590_094139 [Homalodisca vitripennis]KAG8295879.1 hypothetical protein J6590_070281 [Homalodisca vitripennis]
MSRFQVLSLSQRQVPDAVQRRIGTALQLQHDQYIGNRSAMTRGRFMDILSSLPVNDNNTISKDNPDGLKKIRLFIKKLNDKFTAVYKGTRQFLTLLKGDSGIIAIEMMMSEFSRGSTTKLNGCAQERQTFTLLGFGYAEKISQETQKHRVRNGGVPSDRGSQGNGWIIQLLLS